MIAAITARVVARFVIPIRTRSEANMREHWATKAKRVKAQRSAMMLMLRRQNVRALEFPICVTLERIAPRQLDTDNLVGAVKAVRDSIAEFVGMNDADPRIQWFYAQRKGKPREYAVEVRIEEVG